jgi:ankyrin repeat protein
LRAGAQVNARGSHGETALRSAVLINSIEAVRLLASNGPDDRDEALSLAQELGRPEIVRLLRESAQ